MAGYHKFKCKNCGAAIDERSSVNLKCSYCGGLFSEQDDDETTAETEKAVPQYQAPEPDRLANAASTFFLLLFFGVAAAIFIGTCSSNNRQEIEADSTIIDTVIFDEQIPELHNKSGTKDIDSINKYILLTEHKIVRGEMIVVGITIENLAPEYLSFVNFDIYFLDKQGKIIPPVISRSTRVALFQNTSEIIEWQVPEKYRKAKQVVFKVTEADFGDRMTALSE